MHIVTYPAGGFNQAHEALRMLGAKLHRVDNTIAAREGNYDALLLLGGIDINPVWYGEEAVYAWRTDTKRDLVEWTMIRRALTDRKPIFGICRGSQMINVACGGSLWQDIQREGISKHHPSNWTHQLGTVDRALAAHLPPNRKKDPLFVNSRHHQAVRTVAPGLRVAARAPDNVVEAVYRPGRRVGDRVVGGILGVQWHPEDLLQEDARWLTLFEWFLEGLPEPAKLAAQ